MSDTLLFNDELPHELEAAPRAFIEWSRAQLLREQTASTPTEPLYHYTDEAALRGILKQQAFWCFSHSSRKTRRNSRTRCGGHGGAEAKGERRSL